MISIPEPIRTILDALRSHGYEACPVGGCVRDSLRGVTPSDWDICTSAKPEETMRCFPPEDTIPTGLKHGTVTVRVGNFTSEVTTYRTDGGYSDSRRPDNVTFVSSLEADLRRRDFTVNAMALDASGAVVDLFGGRSDLRDRVIRCVGDPDERFHEDALRVLRALRFASALEFTIEGETGKAMLRSRALLERLSAERVWKELCGVLMGSGCGAVLAAYGAVLSVILPEIGAEAIAESAAAIQTAPKDICLRLALLLRGQTAEQSGEILKRLRCENIARSRTLALLEALRSPLPETREEMLRLAQKLGWSDTLLVAEVRDARLAAALRALRAEDPCLTVRELAVGGDELLRLGAPGGREIGEALRRLLEAVWRGEAENTPEGLLPLAEELLRKTD